MKTLSAQIVSIKMMQKALSCLRLNRKLEGAYFKGVGPGYKVHYNFMFSLT